jgi:tRNA(adenine34) deaminase
MIHPAPGSDEFWMGRAIELALEAEAAGEVPVGAVLVSADGELLGEGFNQPIRLSDSTAHAEILALRAAGAKLQNYRFDGATLFATLEPCPMCAGAIVHARLARLVFGARDLRFGGVRSKFRIADSELLNHRVLVEEGTRSAECTGLLLKFFKMRR